MQGVFETSRIYDTRCAKEFRGMSFSGFKLGQVVKKLQQAFADRSIESACFWTAELVCAGHFVKLWETIAIATASRHATASPRVPILASAHFDAFKRIVQSGYEGQELELRNTPSIRSIFAEIAAVLCTTKRQHSIPPIKIRPDTDFDMSVMSGRLEAPNTSFASTVFQEGDPQELFVAVNELCYQLDYKQSNCVSGCYWIEWMVAFVKHCASKGGSALRVKPRSFAHVPDSFHQDPIWISWEAILAHGKHRGAQTIRALESLLGLYCIRYTSGCKQRRMPLLYAAVSLVTSDVDFTVPAAADPTAIKNIVSKAVVAPYKEMKKHEMGAKEGNLRTPTQTNRQKTSERLQRMDAMLASGAPHRFQ